MRIILRAFLATVAFLATGAATWTLLTCGPGDANELAVELAPLHLAPNSVPVAAIPDISVEDVHFELQAELLEVWWASVPEKRVRKVAIRLHSRGKAWGRNPTYLVPEVIDLTKVIVAMQPHLETGKLGGITRALEIATDFYVIVGENPGSCGNTDEDLVPEVNPYIIAAMAMRESGYYPEVERGWDWTYIPTKTKISTCRRCRGPAKERGMFQFMPTKAGRPGFVERLMPRNCSDPFDRTCATTTVVRYLNRLRCACIDQFGPDCDLDAIVASYGRDVRHLVPPDRARQHRGSRNGRAYLQAADFDCSDHWPRDDDDDFALGL